MGVLGALVTLSDQVETIIPRRFPKKHGGNRKQGPPASAELIQTLFATYAALRERFPESGPPPGFGKALERFVRAGLQFAVDYPPIFDSGGVPCPQWGAALVDADLPNPSKTTSDMIRAIYRRWSNQV
jgi:hypothetical protein